MTQSSNHFDLNKAIKKSIGGGVTGASAMVINVTSMMWLRTTMNYQYKNGGTMTFVMKKLYQEGGIRRFYRGYLPALTIGPISRFGDTASNAFALSLLENYDLNVATKTLIGSGAAASFRAFLMPLDALKTSMQVNGNKGVTILKDRIKSHGIRTLYNGTGASMTATFVGHYPWFLTYNFLDEWLPKQENTLNKLVRNGCIGFSSAVISDCFSNSFRVIKTSKQTDKKNISYGLVVKEIISKEGITGILGRGLKTRILTNGLQGLFFTVIWKYLQEQY